MISFPSGARVWLAAGHTDMRKGFDGLALVVQETLKRDPHSGHLFMFRGRRGGLIKVLWHDGQGMCLYANPPSVARGDIALHMKRFLLILSKIVGGLGRILGAYECGSVSCSSSRSRSAT